MMTGRDSQGLPLAAMFAGIAFVVLIAIGAWLFWPQSPATKSKILPMPQLKSDKQSEAETAPPSIADNVERAVEVELEREAPVIEKPSLPQLNESDSRLKEKIASMAGGSSVLALLVDAELIRKTVRAVHGLSEGWVVKEYRPLQSPQGTLVVNETGGLSENNLKLYRISSANYRRYEKIVSMLTQFSPESAAQVYVHFYPLFEEAYAELGLREGDFHEATKVAIQRLMASTHVTENTSLIQPSVMFTFADPEMESLPSLDKLKWRIGSENEARLKVWASAFLEQISKAKL